jgi:hypothetical protein
VYAFDTMAYPIERAGDDLASWERALMGITRAADVVRRVDPDDAAEEAVRRADHPRHRRGRKQRPALRADAAEVPGRAEGRPGVCIVRTPGGTSGIETQCRSAACTVDVFQFAGDYYSLPNLIRS